MWTPSRALAERWAALMAWLVTGAPYLEHTTDEWRRPRVRLHDEAGGVWTVWDATFRDYRFHRVRLGDPRATSRVFVAADGTLWSYRSGPLADRALTADALAAQLRGAGYVAQSAFAPDPNAPGRPGV